MIILPAIDILDGKCVRLKQGLADQKTVYDDDPRKVARKFEKSGAEFLHVVDLNGAFDGHSINYEIIASIRSAVDIPIEVGGGIRTEETVRSYIEMGIDRVILGTIAVESTDFVQEMCLRYGEKIAVSIDAKNGNIATHGWVNISQRSVFDFCEELVECGVQCFIYTDIGRDGMMNGPDYSTLSTLNKSFPVNFIASGGISKEKDLMLLKEYNLYGAIVGKAIYEGAIKLSELKKIQEALC